MLYNIVTKPSIMMDVKKSKYFKTNLGLVSTIDKNGERILNQDDKFSYFYNNQYKTTIYMQGNMGNISFYVDHYIRDEVIAVYFNQEEFIMKFEHNLVREKGIDHVLGLILQKINTEYEERVKKAEEKKIEVQRKADAAILKNNPGAVRYEDLKAFLDKKNKGRYT